MMNPKLPAVLLVLLLVLGASGCLGGLDYDGPLWGDPCEVERVRPEITIHTCHWTGHAYRLGICEEQAPGDDVGACRPFCDLAGACAAGTPTIGPLGLCYCAAPGVSDG